MAKGLRETQGACVILFDDGDVSDLMFSEYGKLSAFLKQKGHSPWYDGTSIYGEACLIDTGRVKQITQMTPDSCEDRDADQRENQFT